MHLRGEPDTMRAQAELGYGDVVADVLAFLRERVQACLAAGMAPARIAIDPGIGFAKTDDHNLTLLARQPELLALGQPLLVGWSRKSTLGRITGQPVGDRLAASLAAALLAAQRGAHIVRVHDVAATIQVLQVWRAAQRGRLQA